MNRTLRSQLETYYTHIDDNQQPLGVGEIAAILDGSGQSQPDAARPRRRLRRPTWVAIAVAAVTLVAIGLVPLILRSGEGTPPATTPTTITSEPAQPQIVGPAEDGGWQWLELDERIYNAMTQGGRTSTLGLLGDGSLVALAQSESNDENLPSTPTVEETIIESPEPRIEWQGSYGRDWGCAPCELLLADRDGNWRPRSLVGLGPIELYEVRLDADLLWAYSADQPPEIWVSDDGNQWDVVTHDPYSTFFPSYQWSLRRGDTVVVVVMFEPALVSASVDRGRTFEPVEIPNKRIQLGWSQPDAFYLLVESYTELPSGGNLGVLRSTDGVNWESVGSTDGPMFTAPDPSLVTPDGSVLAYRESDSAAPSGELWRSRDNGLIWERQEVPFDFHTGSVYAGWIRVLEGSGEDAVFRTLVSRDGLDWYYFDPSASSDLPYADGTGAIIADNEIAVPPHD